MTNLTLQEKRALEEVFLCFQVEDKWYKQKININKSLKFKILRIYAKNKRYICKKCNLRLYM